MFYLEKGSLCYNFKRLTLTRLNTVFEYRGDHFDKPCAVSSDWVIGQNKRSASATVKNIGKVEIFAKNSLGGVCLSAKLYLSNEFKKTNAFRFGIQGELPVRLDSLVYNVPRVYGRVSDLEMGSKPLATALMTDQIEQGAQYIAFKAKKKGRTTHYGVVGFTTFNECFGEVNLSENGEFFACSNLEDDIFYPNTTIKTDDCFFFIDKNNNDVLNVYGKKIAKDNPLKKDRELATGWCSWYYYGPHISQDIILENLNKIKEKDLPVKYVQIDDGWQKCYGDWEENERFPSGMKFLADQIYKKGYTPGIWMTPFLFSPESQTVKNHPEWFVRLANGEVHPNRLIDYSIKGAREWLYSVAKKLSVDWGYRYIKIDLVSYRLAITGYQKQGFNALKNFNTMLKVMRSAVTDDTVFLTCTSPLGASAGRAENVRISDDIFERWEDLRTIARQIFRRYYVHQYINPDPDCLCVRTFDKHDEQAYRICTRSSEEVQTFVNFISAAGGTLILSDKLSLLDDGDFENIKRLFPINKTPAQPLDVFERDIPSILRYGKRGDFEMYAIFNWGNTEESFTIPFDSENFVKTYYAGEIFDKVKSFTINLKPHCSEIIYLAKDKELFKKLGKSIMPC